MHRFSLDSATFHGCLPRGWDFFVIHGCPGRFAITQCREGILCCCLNLVCSKPSFGRTKKTGRRSSQNVFCKRRLTCLFLRLRVFLNNPNHLHVLSSPLHLKQIAKPPETAIDKSPTPLGACRKSAGRLRKAMQR